MVAVTSTVQLSGVSKDINGRVLFSGVDLQQETGEITTIVGPSGVGKTTLLRIIAGQTRFSGEVRINGRQLPNAPAAELPREIALATQKPNLWDHLSAEDNVAMVRRLLFGRSKRAARSEAGEYLELLEVDSVRSQYPATLSGGERQRVNIARALATEREIILLDEVTSNIDPRRRGLLAELVKKLAADGRLIIFVTHDYVTAGKVGGRLLELQPEGLRSTQLDS